MENQYKISSILDRKMYYRNLFASASRLLKRRNKTDPPPMKHDKIPPNKKAEKQQVVCRTTKEKKRHEKTSTPRLFQKAKIYVRNDLLHLKHGESH